MEIFLLEQIIKYKKNAFIDIFIFSRKWEISTHDSCQEVLDNWRSRLSTKLRDILEVKKSFLLFYIFVYIISP